MNKKQIILLYVLAISYFNSNAQTTFQKIVGTNQETANAIQQTSDGGYILFGETNSFSLAGFSDLYLIKADINGNLTWTKTFGAYLMELAYSVQQTTDGGYILAGATASLSAPWEIYLIKTDSNGDTLWSKTYYTGPGDLGYSVQQTYDGGYIITGEHQGINGYEVNLIKTDVNGNWSWSNIYGNNGLNTTISSSVKQTTDHGYIITGFTDAFGAGNADVYLLKTDSTGILQWSKTYGGTGIDKGFSVEQTSDAGYIVAGTTSSFGAGGTDFYLVKTNVSGDTLWTRTYGGSLLDEASAVHQTTDGGYIVAGVSSSFASSWRDAYLVKTNAAGDTLWTKITGSFTNYDEYANSIWQANDGGYAIAGKMHHYTTFDTTFAYLIKTDSYGNSGCNMHGTTTVVTAPSTQVSNPATSASFSFMYADNPSFITGSGGTFTTLCSTVGINDITMDNLFIISPNPSTGIFQITFPASNPKTNYTLEVINTLGQRVFTSPLAPLQRRGEANARLDLSFLPKGMYVLRINDGVLITSSKLIIE